MKAPGHGGDRALIRQDCSEESPLSWRKGGRGRRGAGGEVGRGRARAVAALALALLAPAALLAEAHPNLDRGFSVERSYEVGEVDNVNTFNGNLVVTLPLGGAWPAGGRVSYGLTLVYNSSHWDFQATQDGLGNEYTRAEPDALSNAGLGWQLHLGRILGPFDMGNETNRMAYVAPDGSQRLFYARLHEGDAEDPGDTGNGGSFSSGQSVLYTRDGSYLRLKRVNNLPELEFPDGTVHAFDALGRLSQIRDRFGNAATVTQQFDGWSIWDGHRTQRVYTTAVAGQPVVDRVELAAFDGTTAVYELDYTATAIWRDCPHTDPAYPESLTVPLLTGVTLPDGSTWVPGYHLGSSSADCGVSGKLASLRLPTLGSVEWAWQQYSFPPAEIDKKPWRTNSFGVASRKTKNAASTLLGTWTYQTQLTPTGTVPPAHRELVNTATDPLGHKTVRYFSVFTGNSSLEGFTNHEYGLQLSRRETDGAGRFVSERVYDAAGALQRSAWVRYERDQAMSSVVPLQDRTNLNRRMASSRTTFHDDANRYATSDSEGFDGLGHHRTTTTGGDFAVGNARATTRNWNPARGTYAIDPATNQPGPGHSFSMLPASSPWILGTATFEQATEDNQTAQATLCYDADGLLVRKRIHRDSGTTESVADVLVTYAYTDGNLTNERWYGGDVQALTANDTTCSMALPANDQYGFLFTYSCGVPASSAYTTLQNAELAFRNVDRTIHCASGLPTSSRDVAGIATSYEYDDLGRLTWEKPESGHDGWTEYVYTRATSASAPANVLVRRRNNGSKSAAVLAESRLTFDALGRVWKEEQKLPDGTWNLRETLYDALGQKASVSEVGAASKKTVFSNYDPFGRPGTVTPADGATHAVTFSYQGVREVSRTVKVGTAYNALTGAVTEASSTTTEVYDRQGRLYQVTEPSGASGASVTTTYGYDVGNRLASVSTPASVDGVSVTQTRLFTYDQRGFLKSEQHPEKGASGDGTVSYQSYDARGHAGQKIDGPNDLTFSYERAERLSGVQETGGRQLKAFDYAGTNSGTDKRLGKLVTATRYNYPLAGLTVPVVETYSYRGRGGRVSARETQTTVNEALETHFSQGFSYTPLGQVQTLTYPACMDGGCKTNAAVFADVPVGHPQKAQIEGVYRAGITAGCGGSPPSYCPGGNLTRAEMAVFLLVAKEEPGYAPPACTTPIFGDVPCSSPFAPWIHELYRRGITGGCSTSPLLYCPDGLVTNAQMAIFLHQTLGLPSPPACTSPTYLDVPCGYWAANFIEEQARRALGSGCGGGYHCPNAYLTRSGMAVLLVNAFKIPVALDPVLPRTVTHTYSQGLLTQVVGYGTLGYHPNLLVSQVAHANGVTDTQANDPNSMRRPLSLSSASSGLFASGWSSGNYLYDGAGNVTTIGSAWFTYDKVSRLTEGRVYLGPFGGGAQRSQTYTFDPFGNITDIGGTSGRSTPTSAATNRLTGTGTAYDAAGNLTAWNGATYEYDGFNQMTRMTNGGEDWLYLYTADDERIWSYSLNANFSRWTVRDLSGKVLREWENHQDQWWGIAADTLYRDGQLLAAETGNGRKHFHLDHLGTPRLLTNAVGQKLAYHVYYPFGEEATEFDQDTERMKFTGHERDLGSLAGAGDDLDYMHARHCSPLTMRFLSVDPALESADPFQPQSWNRYNYVQNNPLLYVDPTGEVLVFSGSKQDLEALKQLVNKNLHGYELKISKNGTASLVSVSASGQASPEQKAFANAFATAINRSEVVRMGVVSGDPSVTIGQYITGKIDIQDISAFGAGPGPSSASTLALEVVEQTAKQSFNLANSPSGHDVAHSLGVAAQDSVTGLTRGPTTAMPSPFTGTGTLTTPHTKGNRTITVTIQVVNGNVVKVTKR